MTFPFSACFNQRAGRIQVGHRALRAQAGGGEGGGGVGELVLCTIFFPNQMKIAYPIAIALGNLVDPPATMVNAAGDYVVSFIVSKYVDGKDWLQKKLHGTETISK